MSIIIAKITDKALLSPSAEVQINEGTEVIVELNKKAKHGDIVMAEKNNLILFRRLEKSGRKRMLAALNNDFATIKVDRTVEIIGVTDITKTGLQAIEVLNFYRSLNPAQKNIYSSMMEDFASGKMRHLNTEEIEKHTNDVIEKLKSAA